MVYMAYRTLLHMANPTPTHGILNSLPMIFSPYPLNIEPPYPMVYWTLYPRFLNPYPWYYEPPMHCISKSYHRYFEPLHMVYRTHLSMVSWHSYKRYIKTPTCGISNALPMVYRTVLLMLFWLPPTHGISNHLTMIYRIPTDGILTLPPTHGISNPLPIVLWTSYTLYFETLFMVFRTATHSILNSLIHDILTSLQMVYRTLYTCYSEPMVYRTLLPMVFVSLPYPRNIEPIN